MMRADVAAVVAPLVVLAESTCAARRGITGIERRLAAGDVAPQNLASWVDIVRCFREPVEQAEASIRAGAEASRALRAQCIERGEWPDDEGAFLPACGCLILLRMCARCGLEALRGCDHNALCPSCATGAV